MSSVPTVGSSSLNASDYIELHEDKTGKPIKRKSCWDRCCPCLRCCCPCIPWWAQCIIFTFVVLAATFGIIALVIGPIPSYFINNADPNKVKFEGLKINFPDELIPIDFNITADLKLLDPSPVSADVDPTTARLSLVRSSGAEEYLAEVPIPHIHITPGENATIKIDVFKIKLGSIWTLVDALKDALDAGSIRINTKANMTIHTPWWPLPIYAEMDKTMPQQIFSPAQISNLPDPDAAAKAKL